uniref:Uncharacterized protein n=1 Tax=Rhodocyclus tenuis TaxID=1066 RepID=A0A840G6M7_RHOTE|nr:hypothetical protein [Rhodocyclus tenuis]
MNDWLVLFVAIAVSFFLWGRPFLKRQRKVRDTYEAAWKLYEKECGFLPISEPFSQGENRGVWVTRIALELRHNNGRLGVAVSNGSRNGLAVHELNKDGSFSKRGPYFTKAFGRWTQTGNRHVVRFIRAKGGYFKSSNPNQGGGEIHEQALNLIEPNTQRKQKFHSVFDFAKRCDPTILDEYRRRTAHYKQVSGIPNSGS